MTNTRKFFCKDRWIVNGTQSLSSGIFKSYHIPKYWYVYTF